MRDGGKSFKQGLVPEGHVTSQQLLSLMHGSYRQLDFWCRSGMIDPAKIEGPGIGYWRIFSRDEALRVLRFDALVHAGVTHTTIREKLMDTDAMYDGVVTIVVDTVLLEERLDTLTAPTLL